MGHACIFFLEGIPLPKRGVCLYIPTTVEISLALTKRLEQNTMRNSQGLTASFLMNVRIGTCMCFLFAGHPTAKTGGFLVHSNKGGHLPGPQKRICNQYHEKRSRTVRIFLDEFTYSHMHAFLFVGCHAPEKGGFPCTFPRRWTSPQSSQN